MEQAEINARVGAVVGGKYLLKAVLGSGGMGAVYEAENTWTRRSVALKLLHPELTNSREVVERFMQEAQLASQLRHPNIVDVLDMGQEHSDGALFIVQELLQGHDLRAMLDASGKLDVGATVDIVLPLMGALAVAHRRGVVHRDLKPENIFLAHDDSGEATPKLIDFGISKIVTEARDARNLTQAGTLVGTPSYMSPEQARGDAQVDGQTDVWSLGVVIYEMLCGRVPFDAPNQNVLMVKIIMEHAPRIESFAPDLPPALADVVHRVLSNDRQGRFADMPAFIAAVLQSGFGGSELFERHRRSLAISAEFSGHFQAIARASGVPTPPHVTPPGAARPPSMPPPGAQTAPGLEALETLDQDAQTRVTRLKDVKPAPARATPASTPSTSAPSATPLGWAQGEAAAPVTSAVPRWFLAVAGAVALGMVALAGVALVRHAPATAPPQVAGRPAASAAPQAAVPITQVAEPAEPVAVDAAVVEQSPALRVEPRVMPLRRAVGPAAVRPAVVRPAVRTQPVGPQHPAAPVRPAAAPQHPRNGAPILTL